MSKMSKHEALQQARRLIEESAEYFGRLHAALEAMPDADQLTLRSAQAVIHPVGAHVVALASQLDAVAAGLTQETNGANEAHDSILSGPSRVN